MKIRPVGAELFRADRRTDRKTDRQDGANSRFNNFANVPIKGHGFRVEKMNYEKITEFVACRLQLSLCWL